jgi:hypothetical protein
VTATNGHFQHQDNNLCNIPLRVLVDSLRKKENKMETIATTTIATTNTFGGAQKPSVLLLGMVFAHQATEPKRGQEFRDRVRCVALQNLGYQIYTLDDKHDDRRIDEHCRANFADTRRMMADMANKWGDDVSFDHIVLDYFFSPVSINVYLK